MSEAASAPSPSRRIGHSVAAGMRRTVKVVAVLLLAAYFLFGFAFLATRHWLMPRIDEYRPWLEHAAGEALAARVTIGRIDTSWRGLYPHLRMRDVRLLDSQGNVALALPQVEATVAWTSVPALQPRVRSLSIIAPELEIRHLAGGRFVVAGFAIDPKAPGEGKLLDWVLAQRRITIRDARVRYVDETSGEPTQPLEFSEAALDYRRGLLTHRFSLEARAPAELAGQFALRAEFSHPPLARVADWRRWSGRMFVQSDFADVARWTSLVKAPRTNVEIFRAQGAVRGWMDFDEMRIERCNADLALADVEVRLARDLAPLRLASLQGRMSLSDWSNVENGHELSFHQVQLQTAAGLVLAPIDLRLRAVLDDKAHDAAARVPRGEFTASMLDLKQLGALAANVPLPPALRPALERFATRGTMSNAQLVWDTPQGADLSYTVRARFDGLSGASIAAVPAVDAQGSARAGQPGFDNLSGTIEATNAGGSVNIEAKNAALDFPGVFEPSRLELDELRAQLRWSTSPQLDVRIESLAARSAAVELTGGGSWRANDKGPGSIDLSAQLARVDIKGAAKLIPLAVGANTRVWLQSALAGGELHDGAVRLRGNLADFPFANPASGEFRAQARVRNADLDHSFVGPPRVEWPALRAIDGELLFDRSQIAVIATSATVYGTRFSGLKARLDDIRSDDPRLAVKGTGDGPLADVVRYIGASPIGGWLGNFLAESTATGIARTELDLDIPLARARETRIAGAIAFNQNDIVLRPDIPPFARAGGRLEFSESSLRLRGVTTGFVGGQSNIAADTRDDGAIVVTGTGTASPAGVRSLFDAPLLVRLLERAQGSARYSSSVIVKGGQPEIRVESDLVGWTVNTPAPLGKRSADPLPLAVELVPQPADATSATRTDRIRVTAGELLAVRLERRIDRNTGVAAIERGAIRIGAVDEPAEVRGQVDALPDAGVRAVLDLPHFDADAWRPFFASADGRNAPGADRAGTSALPDLVAARIGELTVAGKSIANVVLGATRVTEGADTAWRANVVSDHATGSIVWRMPRADDAGHVSARLARLAIPERAREQVTEVLEAPASDVPAFDVVADSFELGGRPLGRLELMARNTGVGRDAAWQLQKLEIANPDARLTATGRWQRDADAAAPRTSLDLALDFSNAGHLLARFGVPGAIRNGRGSLSGQVSWNGSPLAIDYGSLAGGLRLNAETGQFLKADAGAARLLGVLSLQSLPRRITLDFRDVFSEGFAFDAVNASADVKAGVLTTNDFRMRGANATVLIEGATDLGGETQDLHVLVLPEVNAASASLVYALLANPAIGLATFLAQLVLRDPLSKAFSFEYDVTGTWVDPQVKRRERAAAAGGSDVSTQ